MDSTEIKKDVKVKFQDAPFIDGTGSRKGFSQAQSIKSLIPSPRRGVAFALAYQWTSKAFWAQNKSLVSHHKLMLGDDFIKKINILDKDKQTIDKCLVKISK